MLQPRRRHLKACPHRSQTYRKCGCPIWATGYVEGRRVRKSLDTRNWKHAEELVLAMLSEDGVPEKVTVAIATERYLDDRRRLKRSKETIAKYELLFREMDALWGTWGVGMVKPDDIARLCESWTLSPITAKKKIERVWAFFHFCVARDWIRSNPAVGIAKPIVKPKPTLPFTDTEVEKVLWATEIFPIKGIYGEGNRTRIRAFVLMLLNTGLRLQDCVTLSFDRLAGGRLLLYTQKTGTPVHIPLPETVIEAVAKMPPATPTRPFWSGNGDPRSATKDWQRSLRKLFKLAGITDAHAHRFRDTFSVRLLQAGVSLDDVSVLLGHSSPAITARHYNPWVKTRQDSLERAVKAAWG